MGKIGLNPERLRIEFMSSGEGILFAEVMNDFSAKVRGLGPLGKSEGMEAAALKANLEAAARIVPYINLVERERLRVPVQSAEAYERFFTGPEFERLFEELIVDKLAVSRMLSLLRESPLSTGEIGRILRLTPSEVSRHLGSSARQGWIRYDEGQGRFALA